MVAVILCASVLNACKHLLDLCLGNIACVPCCMPFFNNKYWKVIAVFSYMSRFFSEKNAAINEMANLNVVKIHKQDVILWVAILPLCCSMPRHTLVLCTNLLDWCGKIIVHKETELSGSYPGWIQDFEKGEGGTWKWLSELRFPRLNIYVR